MPVFPMIVTPAEIRRVFPRAENHAGCLLFVIIIVFAVGYDAFELAEKIEFHSHTVGKSDFIAAEFFFMLTIFAPLPFLPT